MLINSTPPKTPTFQKIFLVDDTYSALTCPSCDVHNCHEFHHKFYQGLWAEIQGPLIKKTESVVTSDDERTTNLTAPVSKVGTVNAYKCSINLGFVTTYNRSCTILRAFTILPLMFTSIL